MKKLMLFAMVAFGLSCQVYSQGDSNISEDTIIKKIIGYIPQGWFIYDKGNNLIFEKKDTMWILDQNQMNAPVSLETKDQRIARIKKNGKPGKSRIVFRYEKKWDHLKIKKLIADYDTTRSQIKMLKKKYNVESLRDASLSRKGEDVYIGKTPEEKQAVASYEKEKNALLKKLAPLPDFNTEKYTLFLIEVSGCNDEFHIVHPDQISVENYQIISIFREISENIHQIR